MSLRFREESVKVGREREMARVIVVKGYDYIAISVHVTVDGMLTFVFKWKEICHWSGSHRFYINIYQLIGAIMITSHLFVCFNLLFNWLIF